MNLRAIEDKLVRIVGLFREKLPNDQIQDMMDLAKAGEPGIAFENLCIQLHEYDVPIDKKTLESLREIGGSMNIDTRYCERLASPVMHSEKSRDRH